MIDAFYKLRTMTAITGITTNSCSSYVELFLNYSIPLINDASFSLASKKIENDLLYRNMTVSDKLTVKCRVSHKKTKAAKFFP